MNKPGIGIKKEHPDRENNKNEHIFVAQDPEPSLLFQFFDPHCFRQDVD